MLLRCLFVMLLLGAAPLAATAHGDCATHTGHTGTVPLSETADSAGTAHHPSSSTDHTGHLAHSSHGMGEHSFCDLLCLSLCAVSALPPPVVSLPAIPSDSMVPPTRSGMLLPAHPVPLLRPPQLFSA